MNNVWPLTIIHVDYGYLERLKKWFISFFDTIERYSTFSVNTACDD